MLTWHNKNEAPFLSIWHPEAEVTYGQSGTKIPIIQLYGIDVLIEKSGYPETESISRLSSILSFVALKLSNVKRYTADDAWCMDRGLGLFAGLNVLPKAAWYTSYSSRITRKLNRAFLKDLRRIWGKHGLVSDTANLDFTTTPYWGDASHLENNWSGTRNKALASMLSVYAAIVHQFRREAAAAYQRAEAAITVCEEHNLWQ